MNGWLIYDTTGAQKNRWFIDRLIGLAGTHGIKLDLKIDEKPLLDEATPDFAIVRTIRPELNGILEERGVRVFNNAKTSRIANDKWETYLACKAWGIPVLPTQKAERGSAAKLAETIGFPCIVKTTDGHGGAEVFRVETAEAYEKLVLELTGAGKRAVAQKQNGVLGRDMRLYAIGGQIVAGILRVSERDFRSNFSLGGSVTPAQADETQKNVVAKLYEKLDFDFVGIDFLPDGAGGWVLNEIEDSAGARMLYQSTDIDIAELFMAHVARNLKRA